MKPLQFHWQHLNHKINSQTFVKRLLILMISSLALLVVYYFFILSPVLSNLRDITGKSVVIDQTTKKLQETIFDMVNKQQKDEKNTIAQTNQAEQQIIVLDKIIQNSLGKLQSLPSLLSMLQSNLEQQQGLTLSYIKKMNEQALATSTDGSGTTSTSLLTQQNVEIAFQGNYFSTLAYLQRIESLKLPIVWNGVEYTVTTYPTANVTLNIGVITMKASP